MARIQDLAHLRRLIPPPPPLGGKNEGASKVLDYLEEQSLEFLSVCPFMILASSGPDGIELSPKGDDPGFMVVEDSRTLLIPERTGNGLAFGLQNMLIDDRVGAFFMRPNTEEVLRVTGRVELFDDEHLCHKLAYHGVPAVLAIRLHIERAFFHCVRSIRRAQLWKPEGWSPQMRVKFGKIMAASLKQDTKAAEELDTFLDGMAEDYNSKLY